MPSRRDFLVSVAQAGAALSVLRLPEHFPNPPPPPPPPAPPAPSPEPPRCPHRPRLAYARHVPRRPMRRGQRCARPTGRVLFRPRERRRLENKRRRQDLVPDIR